MSKLENKIDDFINQFTFTFDVIMVLVNRYVSMNSGLTDLIRVENANITDDFMAVGVITSPSLEIKEEKTKFIEQLKMSLRLDNLTFKLSNRNHTIKMDLK